MTPTKVYETPVIREQFIASRRTTTGSRSKMSGAGPSFSRRESTAGSSRMRQLLPAAFLFIALVSQLSVRLLITQQGYEVERVRRQALQRDAQLRDLRLQFALLSRPERLFSLAKNNLGFRELSHENVRKVVTK